MEHLKRPPKGAGKAEIAKVLLKNQEILADQIALLQQSLVELATAIPNWIHAGILKEHGNLVNMVEGSLQESIIHKELLIEKGLLTREEVNQKLLELQNRSR